MNIDADTRRQIARVYRIMDNLRYRPAAPSDGLGNIACPVDELDIDSEIAQYAGDWWSQEEECRYLTAVRTGKNGSR
jgi:hypothetical protein